MKSKTLKNLHQPIHNMVNEEDDESDVAWFWSMNAISDDAFLVIAQNNQTPPAGKRFYLDHHCIDHNMEGDDI